MGVVDKGEANMLVLGSLVAAVLFTAVFRNPLKKYPWVFYAVAIALTVLVYLGPKAGVPAWLYRSAIVSNARGIFAFWLFTIVMYMGVLPPDSKLRRRLMPIRAELSIFAGIICVGHVLTYIFIWTFRVGVEGNRHGLLPSYVVGIILTVLLVVLTVTSFDLVKKAMGGRCWKLVQRFAYLFYVLTYVHIFISTLPAARFGSMNGTIGLVVYGLVTVAYVVLRVRRYVVDNKARAADVPLAA